MSAFGGKADIDATLPNVRFWPKADIRSWGLLPRKMTVGPHSAGWKSLLQSRPIRLPPSPRNSGNHPHPTFKKPLKPPLLLFELFVQSEPARCSWVAMSVIDQRKHSDASLFGIDLVAPAFGGTATSKGFQIGPQLETATVPQYSKRNSRRQAHAIAGRSRDRLTSAHRLRRFIDRIHGEVIWSALIKYCWWQRDH